MASKYYESSLSSRSSGEKVYYDPRRGMFDHHLSSMVNGMVTNTKSAERKEAPVRRSTPKKREVEIHHDYKPSEEPRRLKQTADDRWR